MRKIFVFLLCLLLIGCSNNVTELENKIAELEKHSTELENKVTELKTSLSEMESEKNYLEGEVGRLEWVEYLYETHIVNISLTQGDVITDKRYVGTFYDANKDHYICFYASGYYMVFKLQNDVLNFQFEGQWRIDENGLFTWGTGGTGMAYKCSFEGNMMTCIDPFGGETRGPWILEKVQLKK
ncbi:MAG: hypothetical protein E7191_03825 [Erysipelotrichaceae bacterium]|nr:hypothetical protein [Erysipelotrichaceae bacterium]